MVPNFRLDSRKWISGKELLERWPGVTPQDLIGRLIECIEYEEVGVSPLNASSHVLFDQQLKRTVPAPCWNQPDLDSLLNGEDPRPLKDKDTFDLLKIVESDMHFNLYEVKEYELDNPEVMAHLQNAFPGEPDLNIGRSFIRKGDVWQIHFNGDSTTIKNMMGIHLLTYLLEKPNSEFTPVELTQLINQEGGRDTSGDSEKELIGTAREEGLSMKELDIAILDTNEKEGLEEAALKVWIALKDGDTPENRKNWKKTKAYLLSEYGITCIEKDHGISFVIRKKQNRQVANARTNVQKGIKRAINNIEDNLSSLAEHLNDHIRTGNKVSYSPTDSKTEWTIHR